VAQHDGFALAGGQGAECGQDLAVGLADQGALLRGDHVAGAGHKTQGTVAAGQAAVRGAAAVEDAVPEVTEGLVLVSQRRPVPVHASERILHHVLGDGLVTEHDLGELDQPHRMRLEERGDLLPHIGVRRSLG
jgi:hypothetical protein